MKLRAAANLAPYFILSLILAAITAVPYRSLATKVEIQQDGEIFPDIHSTYECKEVVNNGGYEYWRNEDGSVTVNYGFFRIHRTGKLFNCK